jgi:biotin carboxyl carrier protein
MEVKILKHDKDLFELEINQKHVFVKVVKFDEAQNMAYLQIDGQPHKVCIPQIKNNKQKPTFRPTLPVGATKFYGAEMLALKSPLSGRITKIFVKNGEQVNKNHPVLAIESMKMENEIRAPFNAFVKSILISEGNLIQQDQVLITFEKKGESNAGDLSKQ